MTDVVYKSNLKKLKKLDRSSILGSMMSNNQRINESYPLLKLQSQTDVVLEDFQGDCATIDQNCKDQMKQYIKQVIQTTTKVVQTLQNEVKTSNEALKKIKDQCQNLPSSEQQASFKQLTAQIQASQEMQLQQQALTIEQLNTTLQKSEEMMKTMMNEQLKLREQLQSQITALMEEVSSQNIKLNLSDKNTEQCQFRYSELSSKCNALAEKAKQTEDILQAKMKNEIHQNSEIKKNMKEEMERMKELEINLKQKAKQLENYNQQLAAKLQAHAIQIESASNLCFVDEMSAKKCLDQIRSKFPNVAGLIVQDKNVHGMLTTGGKIIAPERSIPIAPALMHSAFPVQLKAGGIPIKQEFEVIPVQPNKLPLQSTASDLLSSIKGFSKPLKPVKKMDKDQDFAASTSNHSRFFQDHKPIFQVQDVREMAPTTTKTFAKLLQQFESNQSDPKIVQQLTAECKKENIFWVFDTDQKKCVPGAYLLGIRSQEQDDDEDW
jgi:hypothetical protein